jgi:uncharacterized HAD superfamily protein
MSLLYGIDLDGVCFEFCPAFCDWLYKKTGVFCDPNKLTSYYWHECIDGLSKEVFWKEFHRFGHSQGYHHLEVVSGAIESLNKIRTAGNKIVYITHRPRYAYFDTLAALEKHNFPSRNSLVFAEGAKAPWVNDIGVDVFIDDSPKTLKELCRDTDARVYCMDYLYNKQLNLDFTRVGSWSEFLECERLVAANV